MSTATAMRIRRQSAALGAVVTGVRLAGGTDDETLAALHRAFLDHHIIVIKGQQEVTPDEQLAFAARWGEVSVHPYVPSIEGHPGVMKIYDPTPLTQRWHADTTHSPEPPALSMLLARTIPEAGGDTMWANAHAAYEGLSDGLKVTLDGLRAVHQGTSLASDAGVKKEAVTSVHPVARTHPVTGCKALFVNGDYVRRIDGWTDEESAPLLEYLYAQVARAEYVYRHKWTEGDLVIWDNRCTQHAVVGDVGKGERVLHRVTIKGDRPV